MSKRERIWAKAPKYQGILRRVGLPVGAVLFALVLWSVIVWAFELPNYLLPYPVDVIKELLSEADVLLGHAWITLGETLIGFVLAIAIGSLSAILIVSSKTLEDALMPLFVFAQTFPKIAIAPLFVIWFGFGLLPKIIVTLLICFFPIIINTSVGLASVESEMLDLVRSMSATRRQIFTKVRIPNALPYFFSALKISITLALVGAIVGEFVGADEGLGYVILVATANLQTAYLFAIMVVLVLMGAILFYIISGLESVFMPWQRAKEQAGTTVIGAP